MTMTSWCWHPRSWRTTWVQTRSHHCPSSPSSSLTSATTRGKGSPTTRWWRTIFSSRRMERRVCHRWVFLTASRCAEAIEGCRLSSKPCLPYSMWWCADWWNAQGLMKAVGLAPFSFFFPFFSSDLLCLTRLAPDQPLPFCYKIPCEGK